MASAGSVPEDTIPGAMPERSGKTWYPTPAFPAAIKASSALHANWLGTSNHKHAR